MLGHRKTAKNLDFMGRKLVDKRVFLMYNSLCVTENGRKTEHLVEEVQ